MIGLLSGGIPLDKHLKAWAEGAAIAAAGVAATAILNYLQVNPFPGATPEEQAIIAGFAKVLLAVLAK